VQATTINEEMKKAASHALAALAKEDVPESVRVAYGGVQLKFGREYIIPKPFDPRVLTWGCSRCCKGCNGNRSCSHSNRRISMFYRTQLDIRMGRTLSIMSTITRKATHNDHKSIVYPEGNNARIIKAAQLTLDQGIAKPILLGKIDEIKKIAFENSIAIDGISIVNQMNMKN